MGCPSWSPKALDPAGERDAGTSARCASPSTHLGPQAHGPLLAPLLASDRELGALASALQSPRSLCPTVCHLVLNRAFLGCDHPPTPRRRDPGAGMAFLFLLAPSRPSINSQGRLTGDTDRPPGKSIRRAGTGCAEGAGQDRLGSGVSGRECPQGGRPVWGHRLSTKERGSWGPMSWRPCAGLLGLHPGEATCHLLASLGPASREAEDKPMSTLSCPPVWAIVAALPPLWPGPARRPSCSPLAQTPLFPLCVQRQEL